LTLDIGTTETYFVVYLYVHEESTRTRIILMY